LAEAVRVLAEDCAVLAEDCAVLAGERAVLVLDASDLVLVLASDAVGLALSFLLLLVLLTSVFNLALNDMLFILNGYNYHTKKLINRWTFSIYGLYINDSPRPVCECDVGNKSIKSTVFTDIHSPDIWLRITIYNAGFN
jgi:hypothetical protein